MACGNNVRFFFCTSLARSIIIWSAFSPRVKTALVWLGPIILTLNK